MATMKPVFRVCSFGFLLLSPASGASRFNRYTKQAKTHRSHLKICLVCTPYMGTSKSMGFTNESILSNPNIRPNYRKRIKLFPLSFFLSCIFCVFFLVLFPFMFLLSFSLLIPVSYLSLISPISSFILCFILFFLSYID